MYCKRPHSNKCPPPIKYPPPGAKISNKRPSQMYPPPLPINLLSCRYSGTSPYNHPVYKTTSLLRPHSFKPNVKTIDSVYYFEDPVNATTSLLRPGFYGPTVVALTGFHCMYEEGLFLYCPLIHNFFKLQLQHFYFTCILTHL